MEENTHLATDGGSAELLRPYASVVLEKAAEIGRVFKTQLVTDFFNALFAKGEVTFGFQHQAVMQQVCNGFTRLFPGDLVQALGGKGKSVGIKSNVVLRTEVLFQQLAQQYDPGISLQGSNGLGGISLLFPFCLQ